MAIGRTEFQFSVSGADEAAAAHRDVAAAERAQAKAADDAARAAARLDEGMIRERLAAQDAEQAIVKKVRAEQASKRAMEEALKPTQEMVKETSALGKAGQLASSGLTLLRKAAEVIPGMELGTIIAGVAAGVYALYKAFGPATDATEKQTAAFRAQAAAARDLAAAQRGLLRGEIGAGSAALRQALDRIGPGITPEAQDQIIRLAAQREQTEQARNEAIQRSVRRAGGLVPVSDAEQKRIEALQAERNKLIEQAQEKDGADFKLSYKERSALAVQAQAFQGEINKIREEANKVADWRLSEVVNQTTADLANFDRQLRGFGAGGGGMPRDAGGGGRGGGPSRAVDGSQSRRAMEASALSGIGGMMGESYDASAEAARARAQEAADFQIAQDQRNAMMIAHLQGVQSETVATANAMDMLAGSFDGAFGRMVDSATNAGGMLTQALSVITGAVGSMMTNIIISGNAGSKGVAKAAGNALAGLSAQAFGYGVLLEGLALASALVPFLGFSAPSLAAAGAVMFGVGGALGLTARALGADKLGAGGGRSGASAGGGGGGGSAAAVGTGGGGGRGEAPVYVSVQIGEEPVAAIMRRSNEREARRGGMSGHFAMGAA